MTADRQRTVIDRFNSNLTIVSFAVLYVRNDFLKVLDPLLVTVYCRYCKHVAYNVQDCNNVQ